MIIQGAKASGFEVSTEQAHAAILAIPQFQEEGHFSAVRYQQILNQSFLTPTAFQNEVEQGILLNQLRFSFIGSAFALTNEVKDFVALYLQMRDYDYLEIPAALFKQNITVDAKDINQYYQTHQNAFSLAEKSQ